MLALLWAHHIIHVSRIRVKWRRKAHGSFETPTSILAQRRESRHLPHDLTRHLMLSRQECWTSFSSLDSVCKHCKHVGPLHQVTSVFVTAFRHERYSAVKLVQQGRKFCVSCWNIALQLKLRRNEAVGARFDALTADMMKKYVNWMQY
jgi:hypothetical protein